MSSIGASSVAALEGDTPLVSESTFLFLRFSVVGGDAAPVTITGSDFRAL